jgi:hypothetical protein
LDAVNALDEFPVFPDGLYDQLWGTEDTYKLLAKLLTEVKSSSFNVGVALAEVDKFSTGVISTVKTLGFGAADLASGRFASFARRFGASPPSKGMTRKLQTSDFSGRFLEMRYAWTPAIQDAFSAAKAFEAISNGPRKKQFHVSHRQRQKDSLDSTWTKSIWELEAKRSITYEAYEELGFLRQMGLGNPASILWERIPYSFVIDWFLPIGNYLELIGQVPFLKGRFLVTKSYKKTFGGYTEFKTLGGYTCLKAPKYTGNRFYMARAPTSGLDVPLPSLKVSGAVQGKRLQNALALTHQIFVSAASNLAGGSGSRKGQANFTDSSLGRKLLQSLARF